MKALILAVLVGYVVCPPQTRAAERSAPAQITFRVITDDGLPVANVRVGAATFSHWVPGEGFGRDKHRQFSAVTNAEGIAVLSASSKRGDFGYRVGDVPGYYTDHGNSFTLREVKNGRWEPWNPVVEITFKPITNPIPLYARTVGNGERFKIPRVNEEFGFDFVVGDWVAPHGKGVSTDIIFALTERVPYAGSDEPFDYSLNVTFPNPGDGIQGLIAIPHKGSALRLPRKAPEAGYEPKLEKRMALLARGEQRIIEMREDQNYFIRVRTELDDQGRVKSALFGKISGDIRFGVNRILRFTYYLNPVSLDRNLEFDTKRNLFSRLDSLEEVRAP